MAFHLTGEPAADRGPRRVPVRRPRRDDARSAVRHGACLPRRVEGPRPVRHARSRSDRRGGPRAVHGTLQPAPGDPSVPEGHGRAASGARGPRGVRLRRATPHGCGPGRPPVASCSGGSKLCQASDGRRPRSSSPCWPSNWTSGPTGGRRRPATTRWSATGPWLTSWTSTRCRRFAPSSSRRRPRPRQRAGADGRAPSVTLPRPEAGRPTGPRLSHRRQRGAG